MLIIYVTGKPLLHGHRRREFAWSPPHGVYLYDGKEFAPSEFNEAYERCMRNNSDMNPRVRVVAGSVPAARKPDGPVVAVGVVPAPPPAPRAITLEEAEAVVARLAPERLKKKTGPRPPNMATLEVA